MDSLTSALAAYSKLSLGLANALVALGAIGVAAFAIYVVFAVVKEKKRK